MIIITYNTGLFLPRLQLHRCSKATISNIVRGFGGHPRGVADFSFKTDGGHRAFWPDIGPAFGQCQAESGMAALDAF